MYGRVDAACARLVAWPATGMSFVHCGNPSRSRCSLTFRTMWLRLVGHGAHRAAICIGTTALRALMGPHSVTCRIHSQVFISINSLSTVVRSTSGLRPVRMKAEMCEKLRGFGATSDCVASALPGGRDRSMWMSEMCRHGYCKHGQSCREGATTRSTEHYPEVVAHVLHGVGPWTSMATHRCICMRVFVVGCATLHVVRKRR